MMNPNFKKYRKVDYAYVADNVEFIPRTCTFCGRLVYPTAEEEFKEKLKKQIKKSKGIMNHE